jgi:hypothetical protein
MNVKAIADSGKYCMEKIKKTSIIQKSVGENVRSV